jgi:hypothetical protein
MSFVFMLEMVLFSYFGSAESDFTSCMLYTICLWICGYYFWKFLCEKKKEYKLAYVFLSNVMFSFVMICKLFSVFFSNL